MVLFIKFHSNPFRNKKILFLNAILINQILANRMAAQPQTNLRASTVEEILGAAGTALISATNQAKGALTSVTGADSGSYILKVIYYLLMYSFFIFLILLLVHFAVKPIFRFVPGGKGVIGVPGTSDDKVYWNERKQPLVRSQAPLEGDDLSASDFSNNFSFSIDLYVRKLPETAIKNRLILIKSTRPDASGNTLFESAPTATDTSLESFMNNKSSMIMYLTETNDLVVTFFNRFNGTKTAFPSRPIYNIPLYTPFRVTVVVESRLFTLYMNGKQVFQRIVPSELAAETNQRFYSPPAWAESPSKTIFLQNFHISPRVISATEVAQAQPALATAPDFDMPAEAETGSCY